jgi:ATP-dependent DNA ligase
MRCASFNEKNLNKINYPALCQIKADGLFINTIVKPEQGLVNFLSRNMKPMTFHGFLEPEFLSMDITGDTVIHGEGLVLNESRTGYLDRKTGNGIISKAIKGTISKEEASRVVIKVWDILPLADWKAKKCIFPYETRLRTLEAAMKNTDKSRPRKIGIIATKMVKSLDHAYDFFNVQLAKGREGCILKNLIGIWKSSSSGNKDCVKMKKKDPADLLCTGTYPFKQDWVMRGDQKIDTSNWIGGLNLESADGKIKVNSGSGLDDEMRQMAPAYFVGHVWETEYNEIISSKGKDTLSLFLPIIKERREDKDEADTYELILERSKANKNRASK